jgi:flagellar basal body-associated protein FliL
MAANTPAPAKGKAPEGGAAGKTDEAPKPNKAKLYIVAAALACVGGAGLAMMAIPKSREKAPSLVGPFVAQLSKEDVQVNLAGENGKRYLVISLSAEYFAYAEEYVSARLGHAKGGASATEDPLYLVMLRDLLLRKAGRRTREQIEDPVHMEAFLMELRSELEPLLFPLCVGDSLSPQAADAKSGLRVGESTMESTMRGLLHEHELEVNAPARTIRLDDGPVTTFRGDEHDLKLLNAEGESVHINVTGLSEKFVGEVPIGTAGRVRRIYRNQVLIQ